jgi:hypothetical protein
VWSAGSCAAPLALASVTEIDESLHEFLRQGDVNAFWIVGGPAGGGGAALFVEASVARSRYAY